MNVIDNDIVPKAPFIWRKVLPRDPKSPVAGAVIGFVFGLVVKK